jgi:cobyrinic acid a,c-diamide synthase
VIDLVLEMADKEITTPRLVIAGFASGVGKTTVTAALIGALRARGLKVAVFKCGPDYLDPTYHARAAGSCHNLDGWMMGREAVLATFARASEGADIALVEGVMGLFDGATPTGEQGSTAEIAKWLGAPVMLVIDASGMARTVAAVGYGFTAFDPTLRVAGMICNRVGSKGHLELLRASGGPLPIVGGLPKRPEYAFPERHLGLYSANLAAVPQNLFSAWEEIAAQWLDLDAIVAAARSASPLAVAVGSAQGQSADARCTIGVAFDEAFHFYYEDNLRRLEENGARLVRFSPLRSPSLPADADGLYFGGGYPETVAAELSANASMIRAIREFALRGGPIYAECGGLMYLSSAIRTVGGEVFPMVDLVAGETVMAQTIQALGYAEVETTQPTLLGPAGERFRGHQFRYSSLNSPLPLQCAYRVATRRRKDTFAEGYVRDNVLASYVHAHWASNPRLAENFVASCAAYRRRR